MYWLQEFFIKLRADYIGSDVNGNKYYQSSTKDFFNRSRRYVIYHGSAEPTKAPAEWYSWLHHLRVSPPEMVEKYEWQQERTVNATGTKDAYFPKGALGKKRDRVSADYEPWVPNC